MTLGQVTNIDHLSDLPHHDAAIDNTSSMDGSLDERLAAIEKRSLEQAFNESQGINTQPSGFSASPNGRSST